jgi:hypothetical protein
VQCIVVLKLTFRSTTLGVALGLVTSLGGSPWVGSLGLVARWVVALGLVARWVVALGLVALGWLWGW